MDKSKKRIIFVNIMPNLRCIYRCKFCTVSDEVLSNNMNKSYFEGKLEESSYDDFINKIFEETDFIQNIEYRISFVGGDIGLDYQLFYNICLRIIKLGKIDNVNKFFLYTNGVGIGKFIQNIRTDFGNSIFQKITFPINLQGPENVYTIITGKSKNLYASILTDLITLSKEGIDFTIIIILNKIIFHKTNLLDFIRVLLNLGVKNIELVPMLLEGDALKNQDKLLVDFFDPAFKIKMNLIYGLSKKINNSGNYNLNVIGRFPNCVKELFEQQICQDADPIFFIRKDISLSKTYPFDFSQEEYKIINNGDWTHRVDTNKRSNEYCFKQCNSCHYKDTCSLSGSAGMKELLKISYA